MIKLMIDKTERKQMNHLSICFSNRAIPLTLTCNLVESCWSDSFRSSFAVVRCYRIHRQSYFGIWAWINYWESKAFASIVLECLME